MRRPLSSRLALLALGAILAISFARPLAAQTPVQVADLNSTRYDSGDNFLFSSEFVEFSGEVYFTASDVLHGLELWKTDGTEAGTVRITDLCPGACDSMPRNLTVLGSTLYFSADDGTHGAEPWATNGHPASTRMILDAVPGLGGSTPNFFRVLGGLVVYSASDPASGQELWRTNGTAEGTFLLADVRPGPDSSQATPWQTIGTDLYFSADDGVHGAELWATDGSAGGTRLVKDITPGAASGLPGLTPVPGPSFFGVLGSRLYFPATEGTAGLELWASDGTEAGTVRVADLDPGLDGSSPNDFARLGSKLLFRARDAAHGAELWATDGTEAGTARIADLFAGMSSGTPYELTPFAGAIFFHADDGVAGRELWKSDGTAAGTQRVADIKPGSGSGLEFFASPHGITPVGTRLLFFADDGAVGNELWASDGTAAGTARVADLNPGSDPADAGSFIGGREIRVVSGGRWFFRAFDGPLAEGRQLYTSDGTAAGTGRVKRLVEQRSGVALPYFGRIPEPGSIAALSGRAIFSGDDGASGGEPAASDGTPAGTGLLKDVHPGIESSFPGEMTALATRVLFRASDGASNDDALWASDGTPSGTGVLTPGLSQPSFLTTFGGQAYFSAVDAAHGSEVWKSDGTPGGTGLAFDLVPGVIGSAPGYFTPAGSKMYFTASDVAAGNELWVTDGATASRVADIRPGSVESFPTQLTVSYLDAFTPVVYFTADDGTSGRELWVSDGTAAGTRRVADVRPGPGSSMNPFPSEGFVESSATMAPLPLNGGVVFAADDGVAGEELWYSSYDVGDTFRLSDIRPGPLSSQPRQMIRVGRRVVFTADNGVWGREIYAVTQGILGATMLADIAPGAASSAPEHLTSFGGIALFSADDGVHGRELWMTDGTFEGTRRVTDLAPGALPSSPYAFASAGGDFFFAASDGTSGFELWRLPRTALGPRITATKRVSGQFVAGGEVLYSIVLRNDGLASQLPTNGLQVEDTIPESLQFLNATSSSGSIPFVFGQSPTRVGWAGQIVPGGEVTITIRCRVLPNIAPETVIANQAIAHADTNGDLLDDTDIPTDDPDHPGVGDATTFRVGLGFYTVPPCRVFDSRPGSPLSNGLPQSVPVRGVCGIPTSAKALSFNLTAVEPSALGFLQVYPTGTTPGTVSQINFGPGQTRSNNGVIEIGADGSMTVGAALTFGGVVDFVLDANGYFE